MRLACGCTDIHTHVVPAEFPPYAGRHADTPWPSMDEAHACHRSVIIQGRNYRTVRDACWLPQLRLAEMGPMGVTRQALSPMPELLSYWLPLEDACALLRYLNEHIAQMVALAPAQFVGLAGVPLQDVDAAIRELEFAMRELGFRGCEIASHVNGVSIGDARFEPFFAAAEAMGAAIFVHALRPAGQERIVGGVAEQMVCFPGDIGLAAASMITGGMGSRHPKLRIAFSHGGGVLPVLLPRLVQGMKTIHPETAGAAEAPDVVARRFFYDTALYDPRAVKFLADMVGVSQVVVGTDYPFVICETDPVGLVERAGFTEAELRAVLAENAERFLGID